MASFVAKESTRGNPKHFRPYSPKDYIKSFGCIFFFSSLSVSAHPSRSVPVVCLCLSGSGSCLAWLNLLTIEQNRTKSNQALRRKLGSRNPTGGFNSPGGPNLNPSQHWDDTLGFYNGESGHAWAAGTLDASSTLPRDGNGNRKSLVSEMIFLGEIAKIDAWLG